MRRYLLGALLFALSLCVGAILTSLIAVRSKAIEDLMADLNTVRTKLKLERSELKRLVVQLAGSGNSKAFWCSVQKRAEAGERINSALCMCIGALALDKDSDRLLRELFVDMGSGDTDTELAKLDRALSLLGEMSSRLKAESEHRRRLITQLSALAGLALGLMVI